MTPRLHFCNLGLSSEATPAQVAGCEARTSGGIFFVGELCQQPDLQGTGSKPGGLISSIKGEQ